MTAHPHARIKPDCDLCGIRLTGHLRCQDCGILLGPGHTYQPYRERPIDRPCFEHRLRMTDPFYAKRVKSTARRDASVFH